MSGGGGGGAAIGGLVGGPVGALIGGGIGESREGAGRAADASSRAAQAAEIQAAQNYQWNRERVDSYAKWYEDQTVENLLKTDQAIKSQETNLARQERLISEIDPTIVEASKQALRLLRGEESSTLSPLKKQRDQQRQSLLNSLREQLGPGAETSTAGIQALTKFDMETSNLFSGAQQQALANIGNISSQFSSQRPDIFREIQGLGSLAQGRAGIGERRFQLAGLGSVSTLMGGQAPLVQTAGAGSVGELLRGQYQQAFGNQMTNLGTQIGSAILTQGMSGMSGGGSAAGGGASGASAGQSYKNYGNMA